jgi:hypothetical protein
MQEIGKNQLVHLFWEGTGVNQCGFCYPRFKPTSNGELGKKLLVNMGILGKLPRAIELPEAPNITFIARFPLYSSTIAVRTVWLLQVGENKGEGLKKF